MLRINQLEEIEQKLLEVSAIVASFNSHTKDFAKCVEVWLLDVDKILQNNRLAISGSITGMIGTLQSERQGGSRSDVIASGRPSLRKRLNASAMEILNRSVYILENSIKDDQTRVREAEKITLQLLSIARACGLLKENYQDGTNSAFAMNLISAMRTNEATVQGIVQVEGLIGKVDTVITVDRLLNFGTDYLSDSLEKTLG